MAFESTRRDVGIAPTAPAFWNNPSVRAIAYQVLLVGGVIAVGAYLVHNTLVNLERQGIATGFGFLNREAAFEIGESLIPYTPADTYGRALLVGLLNTLCVAGIGIVLATILGTIIGIARLSTNWLISKLASFDVETVRNIPVLLQLIVWWDILRVSAPGPREAWQPVPDVFISNRGVIYPVPIYDPVHLWVGAALVLGIVASVFVTRWARARQMATGKQFPVLKTNAALIIGLPLLVFVIGGMPLELDKPELRGFNFSGGHIVSPEFVALLVRLVVYTGAFIAEIVRAGILARAAPGSARQPEKPPAATLGALGWLRAHLFNSIPNAILTLLAIFVIVKLVPPFIAWLLIDSKFVAANAKECREAAGACWAFIAEWYRFILFGRFPYAEQWPPLIVVLVFIAMFLASFNPR